MSYQTLDSLKSRKLNKWLNRGLINLDQYNKISQYCIDYGFWAALGYATRLKYKNNPKLKTKYKYLWLKFRKKDCLFNSYITTGAFSDKKRKRKRIWFNVFFTSEGLDRKDLIQKDFPDWEIFYMKHNKYKIGLRKPI